MSLIAILAIAAVVIFLIVVIEVAVYVTATRAMDLAGISTTIRLAWAGTFALVLIGTATTSALLAVSL